MLLRLGCALYRYRWGVLLIWGLVLLAALPIAPRVLRSLNAGGFSSPDLEAFRASQLLTDRFGSNPANLILVYEDPANALAADDPAFTQRDLRRAEILSIPTAAIALVLVFGSIVAGVVPGLVGGTAVGVTLALMVVLSQLFELSIFSLNLATMLGLGLGIDYSLFLVSRFREELAREESVERAVAWSVATAGRAVLFSGATVIIGL